MSAEPWPRSIIVGSPMNRSMPRVPPRLRSEACVPFRQIITLKVTKGIAGHRKDVLIHRRLIEVAADQGILLVRIAPPFPDMRQSQPMLDERKIGCGHRAENI